MVKSSRNSSSRAGWRVRTSEEAKKYFLPHLNSPWSNVIALSVLGNFTSHPTGYFYKTRTYALGHDHDQAHFFHFPCSVQSTLLKVCQFRLIFRKVNVFRTFPCGFITFWVMLMARRETPIICQKQQQCRIILPFVLIF